MAAQPNQCRRAGKYLPMLGEDEQLMARVARGDWPALERLLGRYEAPLFAFFHRVGCHPSSVADLVQTVMIRLYEDRTRYDAERPFAPWLYGIARNVWKEHLRRARRDRMDPVGDVVETSCAAAPDPDGRLEEVDDAERVRRAVQRLPEDQRVTLVLRHWHGLTYGEIAEALGVPVGTVKWRVHDALRKLGEWLAVGRAGRR